MGVITYTSIEEEGRGVVWGCGECSWNTGMDSQEDLVYSQTCICHLVYANLS
jgi:hypothetical protein